MVNDVVETAKSLIATLEEFIDQAKFICGEDCCWDYSASQHIEGFLDGVGCYLRNLLDRERLDSLALTLSDALDGGEEAKAELQGEDQQTLRRDLLRLATEQDEPDAIAYLREHFGIGINLRVHEEAPVSCPSPTAN
jgi:hypothetical protein